MEFFISLKLLLALASFFFAGYLPVHFLLIKKKAILHFPGIADNKLNDVTANGPVTGFYNSLSGKIFIFFLSFCAGIFIISNYLIILSLAKIKYSLCAAALFAAACFVAFFAIVILNKIRGTNNSHSKKNIIQVDNRNKGKWESDIKLSRREDKLYIYPKTEKILFAVICFFIFLSLSAVVFFTFLFPIRFWDAISCWSLKGRAFFIDGSILSFFSHHSYDFAHLSYPLYVPLAQTWIFIWLGYADEVLVKIIFPIFYLSLIFILYYCFRQKFARLLSGVFVLILSGLPVIMDHGYLEYTNLVFAVILFVAVYFFYLSILENKNMFKEKIKLVLASALFFTILAQIRSEGVMFLAIFLVANFINGLAAIVGSKPPGIKNTGKVYVSFKEKLPVRPPERLPERSVKRHILQIICPPVFSLLLMLPWISLKRILNIPFISTEWSMLFEKIKFPIQYLQPAQDVLATQPTGAEAAFDFMRAFKALASQLFYSNYDSTRAFFGSSYGIMWVVLFMLFAINIKKMFSGSNWIYPLFVIPGFIALFISLALIPEFAWSTDRYVLHLFPLTYFWILYNLPMFKSRCNGRN